MVKVKVGDFINVNGVQCLVLDIFDGHPFAIAFNIGIESKFSYTSNNYNTSTLRKAIEDWFAKLNVPAVRRYVNLTTLDGSKNYNFMSDIKVAPLTFDEWRKYANIIIPHIKQSFWLATAWSDSRLKNWGSNSVCLIDKGGSVSHHNICDSSGLAPAFILDKKFFDDNYNNERDPSFLADFSTDALLAEISRRVKET